MTIDRKAFFSAARAAPFGGHMTQREVDGCNTIIDAWEKFGGSADLRHLAYELGTVFRECGRTMHPVREVGEGAGQPYGYPDPSTRLVYYGRGYVQLTWKSNYEAMGELVNDDLVHYPDDALDPTLAAQIMFIGMERGVFTRRKLSNYFTESGADWYNARRVVNGIDHAEDVAIYAQEFFAALMPQSIGKAA